jgi:rare lipoprotein A
VAGVIVGASAAAMNLGPVTDSPSVTADGVHIDTGSPSGRPGDERGSRSGLREIPSPSDTGSARPSSPAAKPSSAAAPASPAAKKPTPTPPSGGGAVTNSGTCRASYYSDGQRTANGEIFNPNDFTAAHRTLPFNTRVRVTNIKNNRSTIVRVNDRGPFVEGRCFDLSRAAFEAISDINAGVADIKYEVLS